VGLNLAKSAVFGVLIVLIGVFFGFTVTGGAEGIGRATTRSVVISIFSIIIADCIFSFV
jgi:phospholipid/cholesterol/gamma-HCH transport system permease protein